MTLYALTRVSANRKVGPLPTVVSARSTCPTSCALYDKGCYALQYPLQNHWQRVSEGQRGVDIDTLYHEVSALPDMPWRYGVAGDLPGEGDVIDADGMRSLVEANGGRNGWAYTHKPPLVGDNLELVAEANLNGFTVSFSANSLAEADGLADLNAAPVVAIVPREDDWRTTTTPKGRMVVRCPAEYSRTQCYGCGNGRPLCARSLREYVVGFTPHGTSKKHVREIAKGER